MAMEYQSSSPPTNPKIPVGLSTFFNSSIRRSRSVASLQKLASDDFRSQSSLSVHREEPERRPKLKTSKTTINDGERSMSKKWILTPIVSSSSVFSVGNRSTKDGIRTPSPPARPAPAPHLWDEEETSEFNRGHSRKDSLAGLETTVAPLGGSPLSMNPPNASPLIGTTATMSPRAQSPRTRASPRGLRDRTLAHRRKPSMTDLTIEPGFSVKEHSSIPTTITEQSEERSMRGSLTPRAFENDPKLAGLKDCLKTPTASHKSYRRSSMLLPGSLAPLFIPNSPKLASPTTMLLPATTYSAKSPAELSASPMQPKVALDEKPPQVPPKSPRTLNRAFPAPKSAFTTPPMPSLPPTQSYTPSHTANSSVSSTGFTQASPAPSVSHTASTSVTSISPSELPAQAMMWSPRQLANSPSPHAESSSAPAVATSPLPWSMSHDSKPVSPRRPMHNQNNFSIDETMSRNAQVAKAASTTNLHQRNQSDSVINRGRPMRRGENPVQRTASRGQKLATLQSALEYMPEGFSRVSVMAAMSHEELLSLRQNAELQATGYQTLPGTIVDDLTKELNLLEDHSTTLRRTAVSLREGRKALHERLLSFLKGPANAFVARDHIIKQEAALSELDNSIDEYTTKLEGVQERRAKVQKKLLEHVGAVLSLRLSGGSATSEEQTPPRSPVTADESEQFETQKNAWQQQALHEQQLQALQEQRHRESEERREQLRQIEEMEREQAEFEEMRRKRSNSERKQQATQEPTEEGQESPRASVESIRVYADHGVASLLASIEKEIDAMDQMRRA